MFLLFFYLLRDSLKYLLSEVTFMNPKYIIAAVLAVGLLAVSATAVQKETIIVPDCVVNGIPQLVIIESTIKPQSSEWS